MTGSPAAVCTHATCVVMAGLPGSGKSTLAKLLSVELHGVVLDKDVIRAGLFPEGCIEYSREQDDFCLEILLQIAAYLMKKSSPPAFLFIDGRPCPGVQNKNHSHRVLR
ncbi:MAG: hypothetical protein DMG67_11125 [Acidobacteria bacterium]|nr:MAG: hypothetical protein DMG67_11125 [Acidobacteriota bacterium]